MKTFLWGIVTSKQLLHFYKLIAKKLADLESFCLLVLTLMMSSCAASQTDERTGDAEASLRFSFDAGRE